MSIECSICLDNIDDEGLWTLFYPCLHAFHRSCVIEWSRRQPNMSCPLCRTLVENTMLFSTLALQSVRANPVDMARIIHTMQFPQTVDDNSDDDDDDGIYLPRYEADLLSSNESDSSSIYSFNNSDESDMDWYTRLFTKVLRKSLLQRFYRCFLLFVFGEAH